MDNKDKWIGYSEKWRKNNPEYVKQWNKQYYKDHREEILRYKKQHGNTLKSRFTTYKNNAKKKGFTFEFTFSEFLELVSKPCFYCGGKGYGIDRLDNKVGYLEENIVPCCSMCNFMKQKYTTGGFIRRCIKISNKWKGEI